MALINCPECKKKVSDRAHSCPVCGFPLDEYFEEQLEEEERKQEEIREKRRIEENKRRAEKYAQKNEFEIFDIKYTFNENKKICAIIGADFQIKKESVHKKVQSLLSSDTKLPVDVEPSSFLNYACDLISEIISPLFDNALFLCEKYLGDDSEELEYLEDDIKNAINYDELINELIITHKKAYSEYNLNASNAHMQYHDDYYAAGTPTQPISEVYSSTLLGLAGASISAKLINGVTSALTSEKVRIKEEKAQNKYYQAVYKERLICNIKVLSVLDCYIDKIAAMYQNYVLDYLIDAGMLFEKYVFPKGDVNFDEFTEKMSDPKTTIDEKKELLKKVIEVNPGDRFAYMIGVTMDGINELEFGQIVSLIDYLGFKHDVRAQLIKSNHPIAKLMDGNADLEIKEYFERIALEARTYDDYVFESVEEKEAYKKEKKLYEKHFNWFAKQEYFNPYQFFKQYKSLVQLGRPKYNVLENKYNELTEKFKPIAKEINNDFIKQLKSALSGIMMNSTTMYQYKFEDVLERKYDEFTQIDNLEELLSEGELLIVKIKWARKLLIISSRAFYFFDEGKNIKIRFGLDEIERISVSRQGFTTSRFLGVDLGDNGFYEIFGANFPEKDFEYIYTFANKIMSYVKNNPMLEKKTLIRICENTPVNQMTEEYLKQQAERVVQIYYLFSKLMVYKEEHIVLKYTYQIRKQDDDLYYLWKAIKENNIGHEFIVMYDGYRFVTDKAIYIANEYLSGENVRLTRYSFEDNEDIISCCSWGESWESQDGFFVVNGENVSLVKLSKVNSSVTIGLEVVSFVQKKNGLTSSMFNEKEFVYCTLCCKWSFITTKESKICPNCSMKLKKNAWINNSGYQYYKEKLDAMKSDEKCALKNSLNPNTDLLINIEEPIIKRKKENERKLEEVSNLFCERFNEAISNTKYEEFLVNELARNISDKKIAERMSYFSRLYPNEKILLLKDDILITGNYVNLTTNHKIDEIKDIWMEETVERLKLILVMKNDKDRFVLDCNYEDRELIAAIKYAMGLCESLDEARDSVLKLMYSDEEIYIATHYDIRNFKQAVDCYQEMTNSDAAEATVRVNCILQNATKMINVLHEYGTALEFRNDKVILEERVYSNKCYGVLRLDKNGIVYIADEVSKNLYLDKNTIKSVDVIQIGTSKSFRVSEKGKFFLHVFDTPNADEWKKQFDQICNESSQIKLKQKEKLENEVEKIECPLCGKMISKHAQYCNYCGEKVQNRIKCVACNKLILQDAKYCNYCGNKITTREENK